MSKQIAKKEKIKCPQCGTVQEATIILEKGAFDTMTHTCVKCQYEICESEWQTVQEMPIDMHNTLISEQTEKQMCEMIQASKRSRVDHKKEWYVKECGRLEQSYQNQVKENRILSSSYYETKYFIDCPSFRFAVGLVLKAIKHGRW